jgi:hypothetical protein
MVREHQTRNLEIPDRRFAPSGMTEQLSQLVAFVTASARLAFADPGLSGFC